MLLTASALELLQQAWKDGFRRGRAECEDEFCPQILHKGPKVDTGNCADAAEHDTDEQNAARIKDQEQLGKRNHRTDPRQRTEFSCSLRKEYAYDSAKNQCDQHLGDGTTIPSLPSWFWGSGGGLDVRAGGVLHAAISSDDCCSGWYL